MNILFFVVVNLALVRGFEDVIVNEEDEEGDIVEDLSRYTREGTAFYRTLWQPRDCAGPTMDQDRVSMTIEYTGLTEQSKEVDLVHNLISSRRRDGMMTMCLGERRRILIPRPSLETDYLKVLPNIHVKETNLLDVEVTGINNMTFTKFNTGVLMSLLEPLDPEYCSQTVEDGDTLAVEYEGRLEDGTVFDSSAARNAPFGPFVHGRGEIIEGYTETLTGRCLGERWRMIVPPHMAYGSQGVGDIPGGATLTFDVRLVLHNQMTWSEEMKTKKVLHWEDVHRPDNCQEITNKDRLYMHYEATRKDGFKFGSLTDKYPPYGPFTLQDDGVTGVAALDLALPGMCLGGKRMVSVPPRMGWTNNNAHHDTIRVLMFLVGVNGDVVDGYSHSPRRGESGDL